MSKIDAYCESLKTGEEYSVASKNQTPEERLSTIRNRSKVTSYIVQEVLKPYKESLEQISTEVSYALNTRPSTDMIFHLNNILGLVDKVLDNGGQE